MREERIAVSLALAFSVVIGQATVWLAISLVKGSDAFIQAIENNPECAPWTFSMDLADPGNFFVSLRFFWLLSVSQKPKPGNPLCTSHYTC